MSHPWDVTVYLVDTPDDTRGPLTRGHAVLASADGTTLDGYGRARVAGEADDTTARHALAVAAALRDLARRLVLEAGEQSGLEREELPAAS